MRTLSNHDRIAAPSVNRAVDNLINVRLKQVEFSMKDLYSGFG